MYQRDKKEMVGEGSTLIQNSIRFTLIELLVVVVIIAILAALLMPALAKARYRAKVVICLGNQKQVAGGLTLYTADNDLYFPSPGRNRNNQSSYLIGSQLVRGVARALPADASTNLEYWGGKQGAKGVFMCPLLEGEYESRVSNYEKRFPYGSLTPFALFNNYGGPGDGNTMANPRVETPMTRIGKTWKIRKRGGDWVIQPNSSERESNVLVGDYIGRRNWPENFSVAAQYVNHNVPGRTIIDVVSHGSGYYVNYWTYEPTSANFVLSDMSGATYNDLHWKYRTDTTGGFLGYAGDSQGGIVPLELLE